MKQVFQSTFNNLQPLLSLLSVPSQNNQAFQKYHYEFKSVRLEQFKYPIQIQNTQIFSYQNVRINNIWLSNLAMYSSDSEQQGIHKISFHFNPDRFMRQLKAKQSHGEKTASIEDKCQISIRKYLSLKKKQRQLFLNSVRKFLYEKWELFEDWLSNDINQQQLRCITSLGTMKIQYIPFSDSNMPILKSIQSIKFLKLKILDICDSLIITNLEPLTWLQAPNLESISITDVQNIPSLNPLNKTNYRKLRQLSIMPKPGSRNRTFSTSLYKLDKRLISRVRYAPKILIKSQNKSGRLDLLSRDLSNIDIYFKSQLPLLKNIDFTLGKEVLSKNFANKKVISKLQEKFKMKFKINKPFPNIAQRNRIHSVQKARIQITMQYQPQNKFFDIQDSC